MSDTTHLVVIVLAWGLYGLIHSWLAATGVKHRLTRRWPALRAAYRLLYNALAALLALPPLALTWLYPGPPLWHCPAWIAWPALLLAMAGFAWSMRWYDGLEFIGLRQWLQRDSQVGRRETFVLSPLHRCVRHPWYSLGLLVLWSRDLNAGWLAASLTITVYLIVGSRMEERKLATVFGEPYRRYLKQVPALIPLPGRCLTGAEAEQLMRASGPEESGSGPPADTT